MAVHPITISSSALKQHIPGKMVQTAETSMMITQKKITHKITTSQYIPQTVENKYSNRYYVAIFMAALK